MIIKATNLRLLGLVAAGACSLAVGLTTAAAADETASTPAASSMKAAIDKETGRLRALTKDEESALGKAGSLSGTQLSVRLGMPATSIVFPPAADGTVRARLGTDMFDQLVATTDESGALKITHQSVAGHVEAQAEEK
jgi:hypothetical protein